MNIKKYRENLERATVHKWNRLDLRNCGLKSIPTEIFEKCPGLVILDLGNDGYSDVKNEIREIPPSIASLRNLTRINLENNQIVEISENLCKLDKLTYLNLAGNRITHLPSSIANLPKLDSLFLEGNPFDKLPPEIVARGIDSIRHFIKQMDVPDFLFEAKL